MAKTRQVLKLVLLALVTAGPALAQADSAQPPPHPAVPAGSGDTCTDVQVGSAASYACLNARLGAIANAQARPSSDLNAPVNAGSPSNVTGVFNESATRNRLGSNFGKSVTPQRPVSSPPPAVPRSR